MFRPMGCILPSDGRYLPGLVKISRDPGRDRAAEVLRASAQGRLEGLTLGGDRDEVDHVRVEGGCVSGDTPAKDDDVYAVAPSDGRDAGGCLATQRLAVDAALAGEHEVGDCHGRVEPDRVGDEVHSYTHLRAHETRHDLVCRLLLEKKK